MIIRTMRTQLFNCGISPHFKPHSDQGMKGINCFSVVTHSSNISTIDLKEKKIKQVSETGNIQSAMPLDAPWSTLSGAICVIPIANRTCSASTSQSAAALQSLEKPKHFFWGGLPALMQSARKLDSLKAQGKLHLEEVIYATDENTS